MNDDDLRDEVLDQACRNALACGVTATALADVVLKYPELGQGSWTVQQFRWIRMAGGKRVSKTLREHIQRRMDALAAENETPS